MTADFPPQASTRTRNEFVAALGISKGALDNLEKLGALSPSVARQPGDTRPVAYTDGDYALAKVLLAARAVGLSGAELTTIGNAIRTRLRALPPRWEGFVAAGDGFAELLPARSLVTWIGDWGTHLPPVLLLPVSIPAGTVGEQ